MLIKYSRNINRILCYLAIVLSVATNSFSKIKNIAFCQTEISAYTKQTDKHTGVQESSQKSLISYPSFIKGKVFDNIKSNGIPNVNITVKKANDVVALSKTEKDGTFFMKVVPGKYAITASKIGLDDNEINVETSAFETINANINMESADAFPSLPRPGERDPFSKCKKGGNPTGIKVFPASLDIRPGGSKRVIIQVSKENRGGCSIDVNVDCISGCDLLNIPKRQLTTNRRGFVVISIKSKDRKKEGVSVIRFAVDDFDFFLPIIIDKK